MQLQITVSGDDGNLVITSLFRWLMRDRDTRRQVSLSLDADDNSAGTMGSLDVINAVLSQATSIASLAIAIASWRDSRPRPISVKIAAGDQSVSIEGDSDSIAHAISQLLSDAEPRSS